MLTPSSKKFWTEIDVAPAIDEKDCGSPANEEPVSGKRNPPDLSVQKPSASLKRQQKTVEDTEEETVSSVLREKIWRILTLKDGRLSFWPWPIVFILFSLLFNSIDSLKNIQIEGARLSQILILIALFLVIYFFALIIDLTIQVIAKYILVFNFFFLTRIYLRSLKGYIALFLTAAIFASIFDGFVKMTEEGQNLVLNFNRALIIMICIFIFRQLVNRGISWKFEAESFADRLVEVYKRDKILVSLFQSSSPTPERAMSKSRNQLSRPPLDLEKVADDKSSMFKHFRSLRRQGGKIIMESNSDLLQEGNEQSRVNFVDLTSYKKTKSLAKRLFNHIDWAQKGYLSLQDFCEYFQPDIAEEVFLQFCSGSLMLTMTLDDLNEQKVEYDVFLESLLRIRRERLQLSSEIQNQSSVTTILTSFITFISWFCLPFVVLSSFGMDTTTIILTMSSLLIATSFALGTSISRMVESSYFLLATKPFNVGDRIILEGSPTIYIVSTIQLITTTVRTLDNKIVFLPNHVLASSTIINLNRHPVSTIIIPLQVGFDTSLAQLEGLKPKISEFIKVNKKVWKPSSLEIFYDSIQEQNRLRFDIWVESYYKHQEGLRLYRAKNDLLLHILKCLKELGITYSLPTQPLSLDSRTVEAFKSHVE